MKGHIRERSPGHWAIVIDVRDPATGKRKRKWHSFIGTKRQAQVECAKLIAEIKNGTALDPAKVTLREYLERWLPIWRPRSAPGQPRTTARWWSTGEVLGGCGPKVLADHPGGSPSGGRYIMRFRKPRVILACY
jgi:Arm DNA-binding domain